MSGQSPGRRSFGGAPASFGRTRDEPVAERPEPDPVLPVTVTGGLRVVDGRLVLEVETSLILSDEVLQGVYDQVRDVIALATADGISAATGRRRPDDEEMLGRHGSADSA